MKGLRFLDRRVGFSLGAASLLLGMLAPAVFPTFASAAVVTDRSIQMSSSVAAQGDGGHGDVSYDVTFTPGTTEATGAIVLWFCSNSPLVGATCDAPSGMSFANSGLTAASAGTPSIPTSSSSPAYVGAGANYVVITGADLVASTPYSVTVTDVANPDGTDLTATGGTFYGRIETFGGNSTASTAAAEAAGGDAADGGTADGSYITGVVDQGGTADWVGSQIGVTADVMESLTFCTYGDPNNGGSGSANSSTYLSGLANGNNGPSTGCVDSANGNPSTAVTLGQTITSGVQALETSAVSYAAGWTQLSTNANGGALVYLQNNGTTNTCPGLTLYGNNGAGDCTSTNSITTPDSGNAGVSSLTAGTAAFGMTFGGGTFTAGTSGGSFQAPSGNKTGNVDINTNYANKYALLTTASTSASQANNAEDGLNQNVDSTYGGFVYGTEGAPATDQDVPFGLAATIGNTTAAGQYKGSFGLIAVGTF